MYKVEIETRKNETLFKLNL